MLKGHTIKFLNFGAKKRDVWSAYLFATKQNTIVSDQTEAVVKPRSLISLASVVGDLEPVFYQLLQQPRAFLPLEQRGQAVHWSLLTANQSADPDRQNQFTQWLTEETGQSAAV